MKGEGERGVGDCVGDAELLARRAQRTHGSHGPADGAPAPPRGATQNDKLDAPPQNDGGPESAPLRHRGVPRADPVYHCEFCNTWIMGPHFRPEPNIRRFCPVCIVYRIPVKELKVRPFTDKVKIEHHEIFV